MDEDDPDVVVVVDEDVLHTNEMFPSGANADDAEVLRALLRTGKENG
jgi:hypothetical protein